MSDSKNANSGGIREAVGVFVNTEVIHEAIDELLENGFRARGRRYGRGTGESDIAEAHTDRGGRRERTGPQ